VSEVRFPALNSSYLKTGDFVGPDHVRRVQPGLTKDQVRLELGNPQYSEGLFGVKEWDYAFNFYTGKGGEFVTCQFKAKFDSVDGVYRVASTHWKPNGCESYLYPAVVAQAAPAIEPAPVVIAAPVQVPVPTRVTLGADGLFTFGKSSMNDLLPEGRKRLDGLAGQLNGGSFKATAITITGHTDRIGSVPSNLALSQARATTVRNYLVSQGVESKLIRTVGLGAANPVKQCAGGDRITPELVACLQPNRRVEIDIVGQR